MFIAIVFNPACEVINFEIYLSLHIKPFCYMSEKQKSKYLKNERSFKMKWIILLIILKAFRGFKLIKLKQNLKTSRNDNQDKSLASVIKILLALLES